MFPLIRSGAPHLRFAFCMILLHMAVYLTSPLGPNGKEEAQRSLQRGNSDDSANVCTHQPVVSSASTASSPEVIDRVLSHLDAHRDLIEGTVLQSYTDHHENATQPSTQYLYGDFRAALEWMAREGVDRPGGRGGGRYTFYMGPDNCDGDGWHVGLANVAAFLGQSMSMVILNDTCDELNWEAIITNPFAEELRWVYPLSNACGQRGVSYTSSPFHTCPAGEEMYQCEVDPNMEMMAASKIPYEGFTPPPLECYPRSAWTTVTGHYDAVPKKGEPGIINEPGNVVPSRAGRTDVEGCCYWGRGALHTGGICNLGKLNYFMGARAKKEGRPSRYPDIDFCVDPEKICDDSRRTMELRWTVALFEWVERVQSFYERGWNYMEEITKFMESDDLIANVELSLQQGEPSHFIDEVGGILEQGCPFPPCDLETPNRLRWRSRRKRNFITAIEGVGLPVRSQLFREMEKHFMDLTKEAFEEVLLRSRSPGDKRGKTYQSYRYHLTDFVESLRKMSDIGFSGERFYIGQGHETLDDDGNVRGPVDSGLLNIALFLTYAVEMSILDDACDEHNVQLINGRFPVSNSCGQYGASYQDVVCEGDDSGMECPLDLDQSFSGVTRTLDHRAPQPFKCAPKSQYPLTGFWDETRLEENHKTAFSNQIGRIDVEGCCWWGRGVLRGVVHGRCIFGQMNHYIGKAAASEGRPALYPKIDFCEFPEAICASEHSNELRWVSGMFFWVKRLQSYDEDGWSYMREMRELSGTIVAGGDLDEEFLNSTNCILRTGRAECDSPEDVSDRLREVLDVVSRFNLPTQSPTWTRSPTESPTDDPTIRPTDFPTSPPTSTNPPSFAPNIFWWPTRQDVDYAVQIMVEKQSFIKADLLTPRVKVEDGNLYTFDTFLSTLKVFALGTIQGVYFYVGHDMKSAYRKRGLVNVAAFLAYVKTVAVYESICDERNTDGVDKKFPLSNSCGQYGLSYQNLRCAPEDAHMECPPDPGLQMTAVVPSKSSDTQLIEGDAPPPFFCGPKNFFPFTGFYDEESNAVWNEEPFASRAGRTDVQSCCWWGRGAAQVKGVCMYGKLNYYIGARAKKEGRRSLLPDIDFCRNPQEICSGKYSYDLMWISGMFAWIDLVQSHSDYSINLDKIVDEEIMSDEFIHGVNDILGMNDIERERMQSNFKLAIKALGVTVY